MKKLCLFIKWLTFGKVCLKWCENQDCCSKDKCDGQEKK